MSKDIKNSLKQPKSFFLLCFAEIWERFGFYILAYLMVLYTQQVFNFSDAQAFLQFGVFSGLVIITPFIGGYIGDHFFGVKRSLIFGLILLAIGYGLLAIPGISYFYLALGFLIVGNGFFKTSPANLLARSYKRDDPRIDSGFTLFYMSINMGSFLATVSAGILSQIFGWHVAFGAASIGLLIGLIGFLKCQYLIRNIGVPLGLECLSWLRYLKIFLGTILAIYIAMFLMQHANLTTYIFMTAAVLVACYYIFELIKSSSEDRQRILICLSLMLMGMVFFILYYQAYMSINLFINRDVDRNVWGMLIPTPIFQSLNPFWILILSPLLARFYNKAGSKGKDLNITTKFCFGILMIALGFFSLVLAAFLNKNSGIVSFGWIVLCYFLYSAGELLISALGMAMVTKIAPLRMFGVMMGSWYFFAAMGAALASHLADLAKIPESVKDPVQMLKIYSHAFSVLGWIGLISALISFVLRPLIKKWINQCHN